MTRIDWIDTVVIGAGHAGLATSRALRDAGREHVVLERGDIGEAWRRERWDSLRLLTPAWMNELPGMAGEDDPDAFLTSATFAERLAAYAASVQAPVLPHTSVRSVHRRAGTGTHRYRVMTDAGAWLAHNVIVATGPGGSPVVPAPVGDLSPALHVVASSAYRNPRALPAGGVLVVGASSSGVQIADELARSGRRVLIAVGRHTRIPRRYRGMDIYWWLHRTGRLDRRIDDVPDPIAARRESSLQLIGRYPSQSVDLPALRDHGIELLGRWTGADGDRVRFADDLTATCAAAERRLDRVLAAIDVHIDASGLAREVLPPDPPAGFAPAPSRTTVDLRAEGVTTVVLATGYRTHLPWLRVPVFDGKGGIRQHHGVTPAPGLYSVGQRFQTRRSSGLIAGAQHDVAAVIAHLTQPRTRVAAAAALPEAGLR